MKPKKPSEPVASTLSQDESDLYSILDSSTSDLCYPSDATVGPLSDLNRLGTEKESTIDGYQMRNCIGAGAMGSVWLALQLSTGRMVALKLLKKRVLFSSHQLQRFANEVNLAAQMEHPNIARIYDSGLKKGRYYYTMQFVPGVRIDQYIEEHRLDEQKIFLLIQRVCEAIAYAHSRGILHRDIKPSNILVDKSGCPYLLDFGLATTRESLLSQNTGSCEFAGTIPYMSPEQILRSAKNITAKSDIYAIGVVLYQIIFHRLPHGNIKDTQELIRRISCESIIDPIEDRIRVSTDLRLIILKCLKNAPDLRYDSVEALSLDIDNYLKNKPITARKSTCVYVFGKWLCRYHRWVALFAFLSVIILAITSYAFFRVNQEQFTAIISDKRAEKYNYINQLITANTQINKGVIRQAQQRLNKVPETQRGWEWQYLTSLSDSSKLTIDTGDSPILSTEVSHDNNTLVFINHDPIVYWRDISTGALIKQVALEGKFVGKACLLPGGKKLLGVTPEGVLTIWSTDTGAIHKILKTGINGLLDISVSKTAKERLAVLTQNRNVLIFDGRSHGLLAALDGSDEVSTVALFSQGESIVLAGSSIGIYSIPDFRVVAITHDIGAMATSIAINDQANLIATGHIDGSVKTWSDDTLSMFSHSTPHTDIVSSVAWDFNSHNVVSSSFDKSICVSSPRNRSIVSQQYGHTAPIRSVRIKPHNRLSTYCDMGQIKQWDVYGPRGNHLFNASNRFYLNRLKISGDAIQILWIDEKGRLFKANALGQEQVYLYEFGFVPRLLSCSNDLRTIAVTSRNKHDTAFIIKLVDGAPVSVEKIYLNTQIRGLYLNDDGSMLAVKTDFGRTYIAELPFTGNLMPIMGGPPPICWLPGRNAVVMADEHDRSSLVINDLMEDKTILRLESIGEIIRTLVWDAPNKRLVGGTNSGTMLIWELPSGRISDRIQIHPNAPVTAIAVSPCGKRLAVCASQIHILDAKNFDRLFQLRIDGTSSDSQLYFDPNGQSLHLLNNGRVDWWGDVNRYLN